MVVSGVIILYVSLQRLVFRLRFNSGRLGKMASFYRIVAPEPRDAVRK